MTRRILSLAALLAPVLLHAGDSVRDRATMKGCKAVAVIIDTLPADFAKDGVTEETLRSRLAQRLREADIPMDAAAKEFVGLRVSSVRDGRGPYAAAFTLGFYQPVTLVRDAAIRSAPETWSFETVFMAPPKILPRAATDAIDDVAARFITAWRAVNPQ